MRRSEVWLYGSRARENADAFSDTDILVIGDCEDEVEAAIEGLEFPRINVSFYGWSEIEAMRTYGSLYLLHVREEGICLRQADPGSDRLGPLLKDLPEFSRSEQDLAGFRQALEEGKLSLLKGGWPDFECEVIATVARHAAILGSYLVGQPSFSREEPFEVSCAALGYEEGRITELTAGSTAWRQHRHSEEIGDGPMWAWISLVDEFLEDLKGLVDGYARLLHSAA